MTPLKCSRWPAASYVLPGDQWNDIDLLCRGVAAILGQMRRVLDVRLLQAIMRPVQVLTPESHKFGKLIVICHRLPSVPGHQATASNHAASAAADPGNLPSGQADHDSSWSSICPILTQR